MSYVPYIPYILGRYVGLGIYLNTYDVVKTGLNNQSIINNLKTHDCCTAALYFMLDA